MAASSLWNSSGNSEDKDVATVPDEGKNAEKSASAPNWGAPATQPWSFALLAVATTVAIVGIALASPLVIEGIATNLGAALGWRQPLLDRSTLTWASLIGFQGVVIGLALIMASVAPGRGPSFYWQPPVSRYCWVAPLAVTIAVSALIAVLGFNFFPEQIEKDLAPIRGMIEAGPVWMAFLSLTVGAPLSEELLFRGYLLNRLRQTPLGFWGAALIANMGWTVLHVGYSWLSLADVFIAGLLFSWALWRTRSIWIPILFHAAYNAIVFVILLIPKSPGGVI